MARPGRWATDWFCGRVVRAMIAGVSMGMRRRRNRKRSAMEVKIGWRVIGVKDSIRGS